jgi:hypothetical protein
MPGWVGSGRNVVVNTDAGPGFHLSIRTHLPSPGRAGEIFGTIAGGSYGGGGAGRVVVGAFVVEDASAVDVVVLP